MNADERLVRYTGGQTHNREDTWRRMLAGIGLWQLLGYGAWAVERKADGILLGHVFFSDFKRDITPSIEGQPEMGWFFAAHAHGQGYASEAVAAALEWADRELAGQQIVAIIDPDNAPSIRVAEKAGFSQRGEATYKGDTVLLYGRMTRPPGLTPTA